MQPEPAPVAGAVGIDRDIGRRPRGIFPTCVVAVDGGAFVDEGPQGNPGDRAAVAGLMTCGGSNDVGRNHCDGFQPPKKMDTLNYNPASIYGSFLLV